MSTEMERYIREQGLPPEGRIPLDKLSTKVLGLSTRAYRGLRNVSINTLQQLINCAESDLLYALGVTTVNQIKTRLDSYVVARLIAGDWDAEVAKIDSWLLKGVLDPSTPIVEAIQLKTKGVPLDRIIEELSALVSQLCNDFERYRLLDDLKLPPGVRRDLCCAIGEEPATLADLRCLVESNDFQNRPPGSDVYARSHAFERAVVRFQHILSFESVDDEIDALLRYLNNKERCVLVNRFGIHAHLTLEQIGGRCGMTREGVRQIQTRVLEKLTIGISRMPLFYSTAALTLLRRQGENASLQSWKEFLTDILFVKEESSADLLVAVSRAAHSSRLAFRHFNLIWSRM